MQDRIVIAMFACIIMAGCGSDKGSGPKPDDGITGKWADYATGTYAQTTRAHSCSSTQWGQPITTNVVICTDGPAFEVEFSGQGITSEVTSKKGQIGDSVDVTILGKITIAGACSGTYEYHLWGRLHQSAWKFCATTTLAFQSGSCAGSCVLEEISYVRTGDPPNPCNGTFSIVETDVGPAGKIILR